MRKVEILINQDSIVTLSAIEVPINVDLAKLFNAIQLSEINAIMIPGKKAMEIANLTTKIFSIE